jgi:CO/xanthine dehydrogenase Mo-binding subunit
MGWALTEDYAWDRGAILNNRFTDYKIPTFMAAPKIHSILIETNNPGSPYGAKSIGEAVLNPVAPAIASAVYHATGVRINSLPLSAERVYNALKAEKEGAGSAR